MSGSEYCNTYFSVHTGFLWGGGTNLGVQSDSKRAGGLPPVVRHFWSGFAWPVVVYLFVYLFV